MIAAPAILANSESSGCRNPQARFPTGPTLSQKDRHFNSASCFAEFFVTGNLQLSSLPLKLLANSVQRDSMTQAVAFASGPKLM